MSQENVEIARRVNAAINCGDIESISELLHHDIAWWDRADDLNATVHRGRDGFRTALVELADDIADLRVEVKEYIDAGDYIVTPVRVTGRGQISGATFEEDEVHVVKLRNGKITELREYRNRAEALKAVGLAE
jgi:ketosteroid isomerase-like protein